MNLLATIAHDTSGQRAVVMVTHGQQAAERTDRIITLRDGAYTATKPALDRAHLSSAYCFFVDQTPNTGPYAEAF
ncbi:hypothetical protein QX204_11465 [Nocardia sp. PE-7]|uniref:hypothetical protein n=1 Tax=Nocardia sp. PE-7 TaxID=3058426 RepID=UPI00265A99AB|nr:hypothetical protein [Nocardia sp. PE-7]WKG12043.1 hypothetical protein QX204_11465 [Nocardia sp. PE-7]